MGRENRYWQPFIDKLSKMNPGDIIEKDPWWRSEDLEGISYGTCCQYFRLLDNIGFLRKAGVGRLELTRKISNTLRY